MQSLVSVAVVLAFLAVSVAFRPLSKFGRTCVRTGLPSSGRTCVGGLPSSVEPSQRADDRQVKGGPPSLAPVGDLLELRQLDDGNFDDQVLTASHDKLQVVLFSSSWCQPCHEMRRTLQRNVMAKHGSKASFYEMNTDLSVEVVTALNVRSLPSILMIKDGQIVSDIVGCVDPDVVNNQILRQF